MSTSLSGLRARLIVLVLLAVVPALGMILYTASAQRRDATLRARETALTMARVISSEQARLVADTRLLLITLSQMPEVRAQTPACAAMFQRLLAATPLYANLGAARPDGTVFCSAVPGTANIADRSYFQRSIAAREFAIGDFQVGRLTGRPTVAVAYPLVVDGVVRSVVFAAFDLGRLNDLVKDAQLPEAWTLTVVDPGGTVVARHPDGAQWIGRTLPDVPTTASLARLILAGDAEAVGADGVARLVGFTPLLDLGKAGALYVSVSIPKGPALAEADRLLILNLAGFGVVAGLALAAAWIGGDAFVLRRVNMLLAGTRKLAAGTITARIGGPYHGELGELARAFDDMAETLTARQRDAEASAAALRESNETLRALIRASPLAIVAHAPDGAITIWNRAAERIFGWREEQVLGRQDPLAPGPLQGDARRLFERALDGDHVSDVEVVRHTADGRPVTVSLSAAPVHDAEGRVRTVLVMYADITERKRTEQQFLRQREVLYRSEKLADLGRLAAGVAHELRSPLTVLSARVQLLEQQLERGTVDFEALPAHVGQLLDAVSRMQRIMEGLSTYSRPPRAEPALLDLRELLSSTRELVAHTARKHGITVELGVEGGVPHVVGDRSRLMQILVNLATNAVEAMAEWGGRLRLTARSEPSAAGSGHVVVEVADTGPGIPPQKLTRIWEAFYTTKPEGTGLGLSIVRSLVEEQPGASITVESRPGTGTTFRLTLPAATTA